MTWWPGATPGTVAPGILAALLVLAPVGLTVGLRSPAGMVLEECRLLDPLPPSAPSRKSGSCARRATWVFFAEELVIPADGLSGSPCSGRMLESQDEHSAGSDYRR